MKPILLKKIVCFECSSEILVYQDEVQWCVNCNWNLVPKEVVKKNIFEIYESKIGKKIGEDLFTSLMAKEPSRPRWTFTKVSTLLLCLAIISTPFVILGLSYLAYLYIPKLLFYIISIINLGIIYITLSNRFKLSEDLIERTEAPELYKLVDRISNQIGQFEITQLALNREFNAFYTGTGIGPFKRRYIYLGIPLLDILTDQQIVALISHEVSHGANGDLMRTTLMYRTQHILYELYLMFSPRHIREGADSRGITYLFVIMGNYFSYLCSYIPLALYKLVTKLRMRNSQEAEYYADLIATEACGKIAMLETLKKLDNTENYHLAQQRACLSKGQINFFEEFKKLTQVEKSEHHSERIDRLEKLNGLSFDATHPPLCYRRAYIAAKGFDSAKIMLNEEESAAIRGELRKFHKKISDELIEDYQNSLFHG